MCIDMGYTLASSLGFPSPAHVRFLKIITYVKGHHSLTNVHLEGSPGVARLQGERELGLLPTVKVSHSPPGCRYL